VFDIKKLEATESPVYSYTLLMESLMSWCYDFLGQAVASLTAYANGLLHIVLEASQAEVNCLQCVHLGLSFHLVVSLIALAGHLRWEVRVIV
jgi:hypothetical protein